MSYFKKTTITITYLFTFLILTVIFGIILRLTPEGFISNIKSEEMCFSLFLSITTSIISSILCMLISIPTSYAIARYDFFGNKLARIILDLPISFPPIVAGLGLLIIFGITFFGAALESLGLKLVFSPLGIVLAQFFVNAPYTTRILVSTFSNIDPRYELVARTLGETELGSFFKVTLPMAKSGIIGSVVITWARGIAEFGAVLIFAGGIAMKTETLPVNLFLSLSEGNIEGAITSAVILILISFIALAIFEKFGGGRF
ncbi:MAG: ABC transporter permease subunit [Candidatus Methanoliparum thermophilum]|uniref:ABC transporter permease subunit n=1 Tax=Methanoliparum thermophilum TaxID=2491083 RepID=A0A520KSX0_METT2|nr:ABC transporter permease [Candidatus Methanoliparum sp. LAM-1]RZN65027.1 MAG: ABC transporter permease subunit [Candidatus Methanoliparum thermophilum]BDC36086.1 molybdate ABC transporter permease [Candidatus Methanoliparum sp. LAM-1]